MYSYQPMTGAPSMQPARAGTSRPPVQRNAGRTQIVSLSARPLAVSLLKRSEIGLRMLREDLPRRPMRKPAAQPPAAALVQWSFCKTGTNERKRTVRRQSFVLAARGRALQRLRLAGEQEQTDLPDVGDDGPRRRIGGHDGG